MKKNNYIEKFRKRNLLPFEKSVFDQVINLIPKRGNILDLGCGNGYPYDYYFYSKEFNLISINFCEKHIKEIKKINLKAKYFIDDIMENLYYKNNRKT